MTRRLWPLSPAAAELWSVLEAFDGCDLRPVTRATVEYLRQWRGPWRRRPDSEQACGHAGASRAVEAGGTTRCICRRCGHRWLEVPSDGVPAHMMVRISIEGELWKLSPAANCPGLPVNDKRNEG